jgi:hypothetical protein
MRMLLSISLFVIGFFWFSGTITLVFLILSTLLAITGIFGICPPYLLLGIQRYNKDEKISRVSGTIFIVVLLSITIGWSYASIFFTKKFFLEDYNRMNNYYKQTLFNTGKEKRTESITNYDTLVKEYTLFLSKYTNYQPYVLRYDSAFSTDIKKIDSIIANLKEKVYTGNLAEAHLEFEAVRPIFQDILKRNGFSLLAVSLVDFHDVMETVIEAADKKDAPWVVQAYLVADEKLKSVEEVANDSEIQAIRKNLEELKWLAEQNSNLELSTKAAELKASFVKVYLKRG